MTVREKIEAGQYTPAKGFRLRELYMAEQTRLEQEFKADLEDEFGVRGNPKADMLYRIAWDLGHSAGYSEVLGHYDDLVELIRDERLQVFQATDFVGHNPVGTSAVVVAKDHHRAQTLLRGALKKHGLKLEWRDPSKPLTERLVELRLDVESATILQDGNY